MTGSNNRFRPRFEVFQLREFALMFGMGPALKAALRLCLESNPPSRLRCEPSIFRLTLWTNLAQMRMHPSKTNPTKAGAEFVISGSDAPLLLEIANEALNA